MVRTVREAFCSFLILTFLVTGGMVSTASASDWWERVSLKGDFRFRHEMIDQDGKDARHRQRVRARMSVTGEVAPGIGVTIQLATGSADPISTNQTLDDAGSTKSIGLDLAYAKATHEKLPGFTLNFGKMKNPLSKPGGTELLWDGDWNPEGGALQFAHATNQITFELIGGAFWLDERSSTADSWLGVAQGIIAADLNAGGASVSVGGGYFDYVNAGGYMPFYDASDPMGNSVVEVENDGATSIYYATKFELLEFFAEASHNIDKIPVTIFADFVTNTAADSLDTGWLAGFKAGKLKNPGDWDVRYNYREVESDAVVGAFSDSDFGGGGTDAKGHEFGGGVQIAKGTALQVSYFTNKLGLQGSKSDYSRLQLDAQLKF